MATIKNKNKKGVEAWWGFLAGAIIVIAIVVVLLVLYGKIKIASLASVSGIGEKLANIFK
jgi:hypothetical protein